MARYAVSFDLDTKAMDEDGLSASQKTVVYQQEIPSAFTACGFAKHPQGSLYLTDDDSENSLSAVIKFQNTVRSQAPAFCKYVRNVQVFRVEDWSDITADIKIPRPQRVTVSGE